MSIDRLTSEDRLMLAWDEIWPQDIGALAILDGACLLDAAGGVRIDAVRMAIEARLHLVPRFRQRIHVPGRGLGGPLWLDFSDFDLTSHVKVHPLPPGSGESDLVRAIAHLRRQRLDPSRPLWEMWFLPGLPEQRVGLFLRMHHAIGDGRAAMAMLGAFLDRVPNAPGATAPYWTPTPPPPGRELLVDNVTGRARGLASAVSILARPRTAARRFLAVWPALRELLAGAPTPRTSLDRMVGPERTLALVRSSIDTVKEVAHRHDATVNDVLLSATASGLRALLRSRGEPVEDVTVPIYVPVSLRDALGAPAQGNLVAQMVVPLPLSVSDPGERLRRIARETARRKARSRSSLGAVFRGPIINRLMLKAVKRRRVNVTSADIVGPELPLYLAGARMLELFPLVNLVGWVCLGVGAVSYAGTFNIGVLADGTAYPDLDVFAAGVRDGLLELGVGCERAAA